jgi:hypothetical protein
MTSLVLAGLLIMLTVVPAFAEPPTGFLEFAWGTNPTVVRERLIASRCRYATESRTAWYSIECHDYLVEGLSIPVLRLDFEPGDALAGYHMTLGRGSYRAFRDLVLQRFGKPTSRTSIFISGARMWWTWPGVSATLIEKCGEEESCIEVTTTALDRRREQGRERERRDSMQSF